MQKALTSLAIGDNIARLTIDNPPFNILSLKLRQGMMRQLPELQQNENVSVLIVEAAEIVAAGVEGRKAFGQFDPYLSFRSRTDSRSGRHGGPIQVERPRGGSQRFQSKESASFYGSLTQRLR